MHREYYYPKADADTVLLEKDHAGKLFHLVY
jgi:hypothetical protein